MKVTDLKPGTVLVWGGATVPRGSENNPSPLMVEEVGGTTTRVLTPTGESLDLQNEKLQALYESAQDDVAVKLKARYWKDS